MAEEKPARRTIPWKDAVALGAEWWYRMIRFGIWDNGDAQTEAYHLFFRSFGAQPTEAEHALIRDGLPLMILDAMAEQEERFGGRTFIYADYHCHELDRLYKSLDLKFDSMLLGPQKAGLSFQRQEDGTYTIDQKQGYGSAWTPLEPLTEGSQ